MVMKQIFMWLMFVWQDEVVEWFEEQGYESEGSDGSTEGRDRIEEEFRSGESSDSEDWLLEMEDCFEQRRWREIQEDFANGFEWYFESEEWIYVSGVFLRTCEELVDEMEDERRLVEEWKFRSGGEDWDYEMEENLWWDNWINFVDGFWWYFDEESEDYYFDVD